jgi:hypothetical protein
MPESRSLMRERGLFWLTDLEAGKSEHNTSKGVRTLHLRAESGRANRHVPKKGTPAL